MEKKAGVWCLLMDFNLFYIRIICECCKVTMYLPLNVMFDFKSAGLLLLSVVEGYKD